MKGVKGSARVAFSECGIEPRAPGGMFGKYPFGVMPGARGGALHRGIGIENAAPIGFERLFALLRRQNFKEIVAEIGIEARQRVEKCAFQFLARAEESRAQHDAADAGRVRLRIGQRQRRAPRAADDHPALDAELLADRLHIRDQMRQRIVLAASLGAASPGAALIEQHRMEALGIEQPAVIGLAAAAGSAVQIDGGNAVGAADGFDVDFVAVADRQQLRGQRRERIGMFADGFARIRVRRHGRRPSPACRRQNCDR